MTRAICVIVNAGSGPGHDASLVERVRTLFERAGTPADIALARGGNELAACIAAAIAQRPAVIVAGGGDGTISSVGAALVGSGIALGVLPLGTLNHFARDAGVPLDLERAVDAIVDGRPTPVDVGEVNGRIFLNNSSLGLYPDIVRDRERQQKRLGRGKWPALAWATLAALRRYPFLGVRLALDSQQHWHLRKTPFVFIGNNEYTMEGFSIGERAALDRGRLSLYVAQRPGRLRLLLLALRALCGRLKQARDFDVLLATELVVDSRRRHLHVATDGEVTRMQPPLCYRIRPASLSVMLASTSAPPGHPEGALAPARRD